MPTLLETTHKVITQQRLVPPGAKVVVGVSGGADSLALLHILHALSPALLLEMQAATLDHGLRGAASAADARFVVDLCQQWNIPVTAARLNPADLDQSAGVERAARVARYHFLAQVAHSAGARYVAVAHHAGDQAETVLMHLLRGTGLAGLAGMASSAPVPGHADLTLIRPLLQATHHDLIAYCQQHGLAPRTDATNDDTALLRNRLRLETLPYLRMLNPQVDQSLLQLAAIASIHQDYIQQQVTNAITGHITISDDRLMLKRAVFADMHPALQNQFVYWAASQLTTETITFDHVIAAVTLAREGQTGQRIHLPGQLQVRLDYEHMVIERRSAAPVPVEQPHLTPGMELTLQVPGVTPLPDSGWSLEISTTPTDTGGPQLTLRAAHAHTLTLRTRKAGDRFAPLGMGGHTQTLKKWLIDHKVPQAQRDQIPLLTLDGEIAAFYVRGEWILSEGQALNAREQPGLYLRFVKHMAK